jgi:P-type Ca2+ transporter type 2C
MEKEVYQKDIKELFKELNSSPKGLSSEEAEKIIKQYGQNKIEKTHKFRPLKIFFDQFNSFLIYILIVAAAISFLLKHNLDGIVIIAIIIVNALIGFFQQYKAEKAIEALKKFIIPKTKVLRNNQILIINSEELVPGDILVLSAGDKINADARIIDADNLQTNEAVLTGESLPVNKNSKNLSKKTELALQKNMLFTGTQIVRGSTKALVISTGMKTQFGKIAQNLQKIQYKKTPMQNRLDKFSKQIGIAVLIFVSLLLGVGFLKKLDLLEIFLTAVALAVSAIPEGLPAILAASFAISSLLMSKKNVLVRKLPAVETLGSVTVICSDKTGTMTEEKMTIQEIFSNNQLLIKKDKNLFLKNKKIKLGKELNQLIKTSILCNNARFEIVKDKYEIIGDPTENALVRNSLDLSFNKKELIEKEPSVKKFEFDSKRKMMSVVRDNGRSYIMYSKGAIEKILSISYSELVQGQIKQLTPERKREILKQSQKMEQQALRVLAFAYKNFNKKDKLEEKGLIFLGFAGMIDPARKEVKKAISDCKSAGIEVKMITGDALLTAQAIASKIGIKGKAITETELNKMSDKELASQINEIAIFARTTPEQKLRITRILQAEGNIVAITGDGVNDSLALKSADIGVAMGQRGTDVARDVSDIVLIDDNFASLVEGIKQGRKTYDNIKKFTKYLLAVNFSEIFLILFALLLSFPLPLLPLQILWINLVTDSLPAIALIFEKQENVMKTKPRREKSILDNLWKFIIFAGVLTFIAKFSIFLYSFNSGTELIKVRSLVLTTAILYELLFVYTCRSNELIFKKGIFSNKWINYAVLISLAFHIILLYTPLNFFFSVVPLSFADWLLIIPFAISGIVIFEVGKYFKFGNKLGK